MPAAASSVPPALRECACTTRRLRTCQDLEGLEKDAAYARGLGFSGKACISPAHVGIVNRIFSPSEAEIAYAKDVFAAIAEAKRRARARLLCGAR